PASHHEAAARHTINVEWRRASEKFENLIAHLGGTALVGIEAENPVAAARFDGAITQFAKAVERHLYDPCAKGGGDLGGGIGAEGIDYNDFVGPQHAFRGGFELFGFVICKNVG